MTTHFTKEQIQQARQADLFSYLQANEPGVLKKDGRNYRHREHDSLVYVTAKNFWYWNSRGKSITALDYLMEIRGYSFTEAVSRLIGDAPARASPQVVISQSESRQNSNVRQSCISRGQRNARPGISNICENAESARG